MILTILKVIFIVGGGVIVLSNFLNPKTNSSPQCKEHGPEVKDPGSGFWPFDLLTLCFGLFLSTREDSACCDFIYLPALL